MANNRMYLVNKKTGHRITIAKYYPSTGWYVFHDDLHAQLDAEFSGHSEVSDVGNMDWELEYEMREGIHDTYFGEKHYGS